MVSQLEKFLEKEEEKEITNIKKVIILSGREYGEDTEFNLVKENIIKARAFDRIVLLFKTVGTSKTVKEKVELLEILKEIKTIDVIGQFI